MEQWIGSVHSKMHAWQTLFFFFAVYRVLEKSSAYIIDMLDIPKHETLGISIEELIAQIGLHDTWFCTWQTIKTVLF